MRRWRVEDPEVTKAKGDLFVEKSKKKMLKYGSCW